MASFCSTKTHLITMVCLSKKKHLSSETKSCPNIFRMGSILITKSLDKSSANCFQTQFHLLDWSKAIQELEDLSSQISAKILPSQSSLRIFLLQTKSVKLFLLSFCKYNLFVLNNKKLGLLFRTMQTRPLHSYWLSYSGLLENPWNSIIRWTHIHQVFVEN